MASASSPDIRAVILRHAAVCCVCSCGKYALLGMFSYLDSIFTRTANSPTNAIASRPILPKGARVASICSPIFSYRSTLRRCCAGRRLASDAFLRCRCTRAPNKSSIRITTRKGTAPITMFPLARARVLGRDRLSQGQSLNQESFRELRVASCTDEDCRYFCDVPCIAPPIRSTMPSVTTSRRDHSAHGCDRHVVRVPLRLPASRLICSERRCVA